MIGSGLQILARRAGVVAIVISATTLLAPARAATPAPAQTKAEAIAVSATLDGQPLRLRPAARVISGRLYLPLRAIVEALQIPVRAKRGRLTLQLSDRTVDLEVGRNRVTSAGASVHIGAPIVQIGGTTFVPLRFISAVLGAQVSYAAATRHVTIVSLFAGAAEAPPTLGRASGGMRVSGTVTAVDRHSQPPTVTVLQGLTPQTISMTSQAKVVLQDVSVHTTFAGTLADIQPGDELAATVDASGAVVQVVDFFASYTGRIAAASGSTFVLHDGRVVTPPPASVVSLNGLPSQVSDLRVGDSVTLRFNPQTGEIKAVIASRAGGGTPQPAGAAHISSFSIDASRPLRAGETLHVSMLGSPGGTATFDLGPIITGLPMSEVSPGRYSGSLPITDGINLTDISVFGELVVGGVAAPRVQAPAQLSISTTPPQIGDIAPMAGESVNNDRPNIFATFTSPTQVGIDPNSVRLVVNGRDVTELATRNDNFIVYSPKQAIAPGPVNVSVSVADAAGNVTSRSWSFTIRD